MTINAATMASGIRHQANSCPLISVIVPVYNVEKYLDKCISSIVNQTYTNLEIILVDDGSTDSSPQILDSWEKKDSRVRVICNTHAGQAKARNTALDIMKGELLSFVDADDSIAPEFHEYLYDLMIKNDADMSACEIYRFDEDGNEVELPPMKNEILSGEGMLEKLALMAEGSYMNPVNKLYRAELFRELRFPEGFIHEDQFTIHYVAGSCRRVAVSDRKLYLRLMRRESTMGALTDELFHLKSFQGHMYAFYDRYNYLLSLRPDLAEAVLKSLYGLMAGTLRKVNYIQFRHDINAYLWEILAALMCSRNLKDKLRAVRLLLRVIRSLFRPYVKES